jgi:hypothetical protein
MPVFTTIPAETRRLNHAHSLDAGLRFCLIRTPLARASDAQR